MEHTIEEVDESSLDVASALLERFFREDGFSVRYASIRANLAAMLSEPNNWAGLAHYGTTAAGIVTVTTARYVEWGRLGEIGDLYVIPEVRRTGIGRALISAALDQCRARDCSAVSVTIAPEGDQAQLLAHYYAKFGFISSGRTSVSLRLD